VDNIFGSSDPGNTGVHSEMSLPSLSAGFHEDSAALFMFLLELHKYSAHFCSPNFTWEFPFRMPNQEKLKKSLPFANSFHQN
jgi:hypothetical protein